MVPFNGETAGEEVVDAFRSQVQGRTFVITGAALPSIGSQMATSLAKASPAHIVLASRTASKVSPVIADIKKINPSAQATFVELDLSDHDSVRRAAEEILAATGHKIDVLINSAGVMALKEYTLDKQGVEMQFSVNHVGHFLLTNLLMPGLLAAAAAAAPARVVNLTSSGYRLSRVRFDDVNFSGGAAYDHWTAYGQAKAANVLFAYGLTKRLRDRGVTSTAAHPGYTGGTNLGSHLSMEDYGDIPAIMMRNMGVAFEWESPRFKTMEQIAATPLVAALDPDVPGKSPGYFVNCGMVQPDGHVTDDEAVQKLWDLSEDTVGQKFEY